MTFSIIIPCYNAAKTLGRAIDSLLLQHDYLKNIILIDDGSSDNTKQVAQEYQRHYPHLIEYYRQDNQGPAKARNQGMPYIKGNYTLFLDADDMLTPDCLQLFCRGFENFPKVDILIAGYTSIHGDKERSKFPTDFNTKALLLQAFWFGKFGACGGAIGMRSHCCHYAQYPETITHGEDVVFFSHLVAQFSVHVLSFTALRVFHSKNSLRHDTLSTLSEAEAIIPLLFNPQRLPKELMEFKSRYHAKQLLSLSKVAFRLKRYSLTRQFISKAYKIHPMSVCRIRYLKVFIISYIRRDPGL